MLLPRTIFLFVYALLFAAVEIEIEGPGGWAEHLPTWYRVRPLYARVFGKLMNGKPLTGYHAVMFFIPLLGFHLPFVSGLRWTWAAEAQAVSSYLWWVVIWDFLWFLLNPRYGWRRFRRGEIWWHGRWWGRFPVDYYNGLALSVCVAALPWLIRHDPRVLREHLILVAGMTVLTVLVGLAAPLYMRWYRHMRREGTDERALVIKRKDD
jgi:hypothetical protein